MGVNRRKVLQIAGATVVVGAGALAWRAVDQGVFSAGIGAAYEPWKNWRADDPVRALRLVRAAVLAANPHNSQPWMFRVSDDSIDLFADTRRNIGAIDPFLREMYMGGGCALENLLIAGAGEGYAATVALLPDPRNPAHAAHIRLSSANTVASELYQAIPRRHTNRGRYDTGRTVPADALDRLAALGADLPEIRVIWFSTPEQRARVGDLIVAATEAIIADEQQSRDSAKWFRSSWRQVQDMRDGITLDAQSLPPLINAAAKILPPFDREAGDKAWLQATREQHVATAAAFGLLVVSDPRDNAMRIRGGRLWQRMHLSATVQGLAAQPLDQMPERADREQQLGIEPRFGTALKELVADTGMQALMPFRIGYPTAVAKPSPRRDLKSVLV
jgi:nitroreductase